MFSFQKVWQELGRVAANGGADQRIQTGAANSVPS